MNDIIVRGALCSLNKLTNLNKRLFGKLGVMQGKRRINRGASFIQKITEKTTCNSRLTGKRGLAGFRDTFCWYFTVKNCIKKWWKFAYRFLRKVEMTPRHRVETTRDKSLASYVLYLATIKILFCVCLAHARQQGLGTPVATGVAFQNSYPVTGKILSAITNEPLDGATISIQGKQIKVLTNADGAFRMLANDSSGVLLISFVGYKSAKINFSRREAGSLTILLERNGTQLEEVQVNTGYQTLPRERATGSFVQIDKELLNRRVSTNILDRLDGMAPGVFFNNSNTGDIARTPLFKNTGINIRGESTLHSSTDPLIVVDNFPYEGELSNINPNDIESITILKDAAAASIWGARAGNGVIVITTKKGKKGEKLTINAAANVSIVDKPDLDYDPFFISSRDYIDLEKYLFAQGYFDNDLNDTRSWPAVSPVVDLLAKHRAGKIVQPLLEQKLDEWGTHDVRDQYKRYVYRKALNQQYYIGLNGGSDKVSYSFSVGHDNNRNSLIENYFQRTSLNANQTYQITDKLSVSTTLNYSLNNTTTNNDFSYGSYSSIGGRYNRIYPYA